MIRKCKFKQPGNFLYDLKSICWLRTIAHTNLVAEPSESKTLCNLNATTPKSASGIFSKKELHLSMTAETISEWINKILSN